MSFALLAVANRLVEKHLNDETPLQSNVHEPEDDEEDGDSEVFASQERKVEKPVDEKYPETETTSVRKTPKR